MTSFWEVLDRAVNTGPIVSPESFDMKIFNKIMEFQKEYDIKYNPDTLIPEDDTMIDDIFEAGFRLFLETGIEIDN